jgi:diacylglycerol kinase (ATP)
MRILLIHNPRAGVQEQPDEEALTRLIRGAGHDVVSRSCEDDGSIEAEATREGCGLIAVSGGDGTAGRIVKRLVGCTVPITLIPLGTANNIARSLGLADLSLAQLVAGWDHPRIVPVDIGVIDAPWGSDRFIEGVGVGLFTRTMLEIDELNCLAHLATPAEKVASALAILRDRLQTFPVRHLDLLLDGKDLSGEYLMLEAMNIRFVGPNLYVAPGCDPGDGLLDVVLVAEKERDILLADLAKWRQGKFVPPQLPTYRGAHLQIVWHGSSLHVDDEAWPAVGDGPYPVPALIDIRVEKHALHVAVPSAAAPT